MSDASSPVIDVLGYMKDGESGTKPKRAALQWRDSRGGGSSG
jgi:hypothetical protein